MTKNYYLAKDVKNMDGGYCPYIVGVPTNIPRGYPLYESPMRNAPIYQRSYTPTLGVRRNIVPVRRILPYNYNIRRRVHSPIYRTYQSRALSPVPRFYHRRVLSPYNTRTITIPGSDSPNIELGDADSIVRGVADLDSRRLVSRPVYHIPDGVNKDDKTDIEIKIGDKILFYINVSYKDVTTVLDELYTDSINTVSDGDKLVLVNISITNLKAHLWTKSDNLTKNIENICKGCTGVQLKDKDKKDVQKDPTTNKYDGAALTNFKDQLKKDLDGLDYKSYNSDGKYVKIYMTNYDTSWLNHFRRSILGPYYGSNYKTISLF